MEELFKVIRKLQDQIEELKAEIVELKKENAELKEKLGLNSKNSSIPSSKELYKLKKEKPKSERNVTVNKNPPVMLTKTPPFKQKILARGSLLHAF